MNKFLLFKYLFGKAQDCYERKEFMIALKYLNETIFFSFSLPSKFISDTYELRGLIKMHLNQHMESIIDFNKAIGEKSMIDQSSTVLKDKHPSFSRSL